MPDSAAHLEKAAANERFLTRVVEDRLSAEWAVTVLFYQAVHLVEAWFGARGVHHRSHVRRNQAVAKDLPEIVASYRKLHDLSRAARYGHVELIGWSDYDDAAIAFAAVDDHFGSDAR